MKKRAKGLVATVGIPCILIFFFFVFLLITAAYQKMNILSLFTDVLRRWGMYGILVLAMVPGIQSGIGLNFGVSLGIVSGLIGSLVSVELKLAKWATFENSPGTAAIFSFLIAIIIAVVVAAIVGTLYGMVLNQLKGSEMTVSTYVGFSAIAFMNILWLVLPFRNTDSIWPVGGTGLRNTINLEGYYAFILNNFLGVHIGGQKIAENGVDYIGNIITFGPEKMINRGTALLKESLYIPTGLLLFFFLACGLVWLFLRSKTGLAMSAAGANPDYARSSGINPNKTRIIGTMISTVLGAIGIVVYSQSYGFIQLYNAPLMMGFACVAAVLIGGATITRSRILNVLIGTFLFQGVLSVALPVANNLMPESNLADIARLVISNGIILYALTRSGGEASNE